METLTIEKFEKRKQTIYSVKNSIFSADIDVDIFGILVDVDVAVASTSFTGAVELDVDIVSCFEENKLPQNLTENKFLLGRKRLHVAHYFGTNTRILRVTYVYSFGLYVLINLVSYKF